MGVFTIEMTHLMLLQRTKKGMCPCSESHTVLDLNLFNALQIILETIAAKDV